MRSVFGALLALLLVTTVNADTPPAGSGAFQVVIEDELGADGIGVFGAVTGPSHPAGEGSEVLSLRDAQDAFSSYVTVRSFTTGTDYVVSALEPASGNPIVELEQYASLSAAAAGYDVSYEVPPDSPSAEALSIVQSLSADPAGLTLRVEVTNDNDFPVTIGVRALLDIASAGDDGPSVEAGGSTHANEGVLTGAEAGATFGQGFPIPVTADPPATMVTFAHWNRAFESAFDFTPDGSDITTTGGLDDSALLYFFGDSQGSANTLAPGQSMVVSVSLGGTEVCDNGIDDDGDGLADGLDPDCGEPPSPTPTAVPATTTVAPSPTPSEADELPASLPGTGGFLGLGLSNEAVNGIGIAGLLVLIPVVGAFVAHRRARRTR